MSAIARPIMRSEQDIHVSLGRTWTSSQSDGVQLSKMFSTLPSKLERSWEKGQHSLFHLRRELQPISSTYTNRDTPHNTQANTLAKVETSQVKIMYCSFAVNVANASQNQATMCISS